MNLNDIIQHGVILAGLSVAATAMICAALYFFTDTFSRGKTIGGEPLVKISFEDEVLHLRAEVARLHRELHAANVRANNAAFPFPVIGNTVWTPHTALNGNPIAVNVEQ